MLLDRRTFIALAASSSLPWVAPGRADAGIPEICAPDGIALGGRDAVSYLTEGLARPGSRDNALQWRGALWLFASETTMERFEMNPNAFAPQYGGYCAMSMAQGNVANGDPDVWEVYDGRLYLIRDQAARQLWHSDVAANVADADANWPGLLHG